MRRAILRVFVLVSMLPSAGACCAAAAGEADDSAGPAGSLVIIGGGLDSANAPLIKAVLDGRRDGRPICVVPLASSEPQRAAALIVADLERYGGPAAGRAVDLVAEHPERAADPVFVEQIAACGGFYFTGGDQSRIVDVLRPRGESTPAHAAILDVARAGGVIAGSSAGAAMMSDPMIGGGEPPDALRFGVVASESERGVWLRNGMGFLAGALTDQHLLARGRTARLLAVLAERPDVQLAFGVDENTGFEVKGGAGRVVGASGVVVVDARQARRNDGGLAGARLWLLGDGDTFAIPAGTAGVAPAKADSPLETRRGRLAVPAKPWDGAAFAQFLARFAANRAATVELPAGRFTLHLRKAAAFRAYAQKGRGPRKMPKALYAGPFEIDLVLVANAADRPFESR